MENPLSTPAVFRLRDGKYQIFAAAVAHTLGIHAGINMAFSTVILPQVMNSTVVGNTTEHLDVLTVDKDQASWIASLVTITTPVGSILSGCLMDRYGRKTVCLMTAVCLIIAWITTASVTSQVYLLYIARSFTGFGSGLSTAALIYVSEISHATLRPMLLSLNSGFVSFGILLVTLFGHILPWRSIAWINTALASTSLVVIFFLPESPVYLSNLQSGNDTKNRLKVKKSVRWLYQEPETSQAEIDSLIKSKTEAALRSLNQQKQEHPEVSYLRPVFLLFGLFFLQQFSGGYIVIFYAIPIFQEIGTLELNEWTSLIILGVIRFLMAILSTFLSRTVGRRLLLMTSAGGMTATLFAAYLSLSFSSAHTITTSCILLYVCFSSYGLLVIPWTLIGELLPNKIRGKGSGIMISFAYLLMFATIKMFLYTLDLIGLGNTLLFLGVTSAVAVIYVYYLIPETLGKTFEEIAKSFGK